MAIRRTKTRVVFIVNPIAGNSHTELFPDFVKRVLNHNRFCYEIVFTEYAGHAIALGNEAAKSEFDLVVAVGGDGTINEVARELIHSDKILGIIPSGSGNGLARHLNIPLNFEGALRLINTGNQSKIDTATINDRAFISIAGVGFDALVAEKFANDPNRGFLTYFKLAAANYQSYQPETYTIIIDHKREIVAEALFISLANSSQFGYNTTIAPQAVLNDGLIDLCIVEKPTIFDMPLIANLLLLKMIHKSKFVTIHKARHVEIKRSGNRVVNIDGEPLMLEKDLVIDINPLSLNIIIP